MQPPGSCALRVGVGENRAVRTRGQPGLSPVESRDGRRRTQ